MKPNEIQIWSTDLRLDPDQEAEQFAVLSTEEQQRALRFHFPIHKTRFIATRFMLRKILSDYLQITPGNIVFAYTEHQKPYLKSPENTPLQFNVSNSDDIGLFAFTLDHAIGVDIEKIQESYNAAVAERFFSSAENLELKQLAKADQIAGFYRIWSRKEALVKAVGKGLSIPLTSFSVSLIDSPQFVALEDYNWHLIPLITHSGYESAVASNQMIKNITLCQYSNNNKIIVSDTLIR